MRYWYLFLVLICGASRFSQITVPSSYGIYAPQLSTVVSTILCGAYTVAGVYKAFMCHNLGADISLDPHTPVQGIHGNYYQWGGIAPVANASTTDGAIIGWNTTLVAVGAWTDGSKTATDPCPSGFRVPTQAQWSYIATSPTVNFVSRTGTWENSSSNFGSAIHFGASAGAKTLTLPAAGIHYQFNIAIRGSTGVYWSSTYIVSKSPVFYFNGNTVGYFNNACEDGLSVRCISE